VKKLIIALLLASGCAHVPPSLSPAGQAAFQATRVVKALDVLQDFAIAAEAQTPKLISTNDTRKVVNFVGSAVKTIDAVPGGWRPTVAAELVQLERDLPPTTWKRLAPYVQLLKVLMEGL
jgi:hypothetical protein